MGARWVIGLLGLASGIAVAGEPKPTPVEIKAFRDKLYVLEDAQGGTYVVLPGDAARVWFGTGTTLYEQVVTSRFQNRETDGWDFSVWAPRVPNLQPGSVQKKDDGSFHRWCGDSSDTTLKAVPADRAKKIIDKATFMSTAMVRRPHLLARDDTGTYYYIDIVREQYGGSGYRVFAGKKGAMKQLALSDVASDTAGEVFATRSGDVRFIHDTGEGTKVSVTWVKGDKRTPLVYLDADRNSRLIYKELGIYGFLGTICDDL